MPDGHAAKLLHILFLYNLHTNSMWWPYTDKETGSEWLRNVLEVSESRQSQKLDQATCLHKVLSDLVF